MTAAELAALADLLRQRNIIDEEIAGLIGRPMASGYAGEWIASRIFDLDLESSPANPAYDGRFTSGALQGRTVNVKWYAGPESRLDMTIAPAPDHYLVLTGPRPGSTPTRPWVIDAVYLFSSAELLAERKAQDVRIGVATSVPAAMWTAAEIYPRPSSRLPLRPDQVEILRRFGADPQPPSASTPG